MLCWLFTRVSLSLLVLQQELIRFRECLQSFVNSELITEEDTDVSTPAVAAMEEEIQRCQHEFVSMSFFFVYVM